MMIRHHLSVCVSLAFACYLVGLCTTTAAVAADKRPNIIFFLTDDQRYDHMGCAGHPVLKTPTMDHLAAGGVRFTNAFVTTPICAASRASMFTGLHERTHKYTFFAVPLAKSLTDNSYPSLLRAAGYRTGFFGKFGVEVQPGVRQQMFDAYERIFRAPYLKKQPDGSLRHTTELIGDRAIDFLKAQSTDQPFCLSLSFNAPHAEDADKKTPYPCPRAVDGMYDDLTIAPAPLSAPEIFNSQPDFLKRSLNRQRWYWRWDTPEKYQKNVKGYYRMITGIDRTMGRVLKQVSELGMADNTVILFAADNGYYRASRGFAGKWSHYDESLRVPMIVYDPRQPSSRAGQVAPSMALNIDIPVTILDLAGVKAPTTYQGRSLVPLISGKTPSDWRTDFFCEHLMNYPVNLPKWEGIRDQRWVYARYFEQHPIYEFLHDLEKDPNELTNAAHDPASAEALQKMRQRCDELRDQYGGPYQHASFPLVNDPSLEPAPKQRQTIKPNPKRPPNVVLIISDDQTWTDFSFMGHPDIQTPRIDELAAESARFTRGYVPTALCRPSLATLVPGLYPHQHGIVGNDPAPPPGVNYSRENPEYLALCERVIQHIDRVPTLPKLLAQHGYVSFQCGKWWEGNYRRGGFTSGMTHGDPKRGGRHGDEGLKIGRNGMEPIFDFVRSAEDKPFFIWYAPFLPHAPHNPPERLLKKYQKPGRPLALARYYAMCEWFDETCGQLIDFLAEQGLRDNTLIAFVVDNGWIQRTEQTEAPAGWRYGFAPRSKQSPYDGGVRTPILLSWPGKIRPRYIESPISSVDLVPTILSACGVEPPKSMPGMNLLDVCAGMPPSRTVVYGECYAHDIRDVDDPTKSLLGTWCVDGCWKLILNHEGKVGRYQLVHNDRVREPQLFDLLADPNETINRAKMYPDVVRRLTGELRQWWPQAVQSPAPNAAK